VTKTYSFWFNGDYYVKTTRWWFWPSKYHINAVGHPRKYWLQAQQNLHDFMRSIKGDNE
jgi:hypothetical protein